MFQICGDVQSVSKTMYNQEPVLCRLLRRRLLRLLRLRRLLRRRLLL